MVGGEDKYRVIDPRLALDGLEILANGDISGCMSIRANYKQGNIYEDSFVDVWNNRFEPMRDRRWMKKDECAKCRVWEIIVQKYKIKDVSARNNKIFCRNEWNFQKSRYICEIKIA